jgi:hypothetical protein
MGSEEKSRRESGRAGTLSRACWRRALYEWMLRKKKGNVQPHLLEAMCVSDYLIRFLFVFLISG